MTTSKLGASSQLAFPSPSSFPLPSTPFPNLLRPASTSRASNLVLADDGDDDDDQTHFRAAARSPPPPLAARLFCTSDPLPPSDDPLLSRPDPDDRFDQPSGDLEQDVLQASAGSCVERLRAPGDGRRLGGLGHFSPSRARPLGDRSSSIRSSLLQLACRPRPAPPLLLLRCSLRPPSAMALRSASSMLGRLPIASSSRATTPAAAAGFVRRRPTPASALGRRTTYSLIRDVKKEPIVDGQRGASRSPLPRNHPFAERDSEKRASRLVQVRP